MCEKGIGVKLGKEKEKDLTNGHVSEGHVKHAVKPNRMSSPKVGDQLHPTAWQKGTVPFSPGSTSK